jgi:hypothetical protein
VVITTQQVKQKQVAVAVAAVVVAAVATVVVAVGAHKFLEHYHHIATQRVVGGPLLAQEVVVFMVAQMVVMELVVAKLEPAEI